MMIYVIIRMRVVVVAAVVVRGGVVVVTGHDLELILMNFDAKRN